MRSRKAFTPAVLMLVLSLLNGHWTLGGAATKPASDNFFTDAVWNGSWSQEGFGKREAVSASMNLKVTKRKDNEFAARVVLNYPNTQHVFEVVGALKGNQVRWKTSKEIKSVGASHPSVAAVLNDAGDSMSGSFDGGTDARGRPFKGTIDLSYNEDPKRR